MVMAGGPRKAVHLTSRVAAPCKCVSVLDRWADRGRLDPTSRRGRPSLGASAHVSAARERLHRPFNAPKPRRCLRPTPRRSRPGLLAVREPRKYGVGSRNGRSRTCPVSDARAAEARASAPHDRLANRRRTRFLSARSGSGCAPPTIARTADTQVRLWHPRREWKLNSRRAAAPAAQRQWRVRL